MTEVGCANDKCCGGRNCDAKAMHMHDDCKNHVPTMEFAGFGRAYVPRQRLCELFPGNEAFVAGTIFPELYQPYESRFAAQNLEDKEGECFA